MKKYLLILLSIFMLCTTACSSNTPDSIIETISTGQTTFSVELEDNIVETEEYTAAATESNGMATINTDHFSVQIPQEWENTCAYEIGDTWISFTHKKSADYGGHLFTISLEDLTYYSDTEAEILGGLGIPNLGEFNVWVHYPSDIQFDMENAEEYKKCSSEIENIISTISFNEGYYFSKTPYEIEKEELPEYPTPETNVQTGTPATDSSASALSDSALEHQAHIYLNQIASKLKNEYRNNGYRMFNASVDVMSISVINRTNDTVLVRGTLNLWYDGGGYYDDRLSVTLVMNPYSGNLIDWYYK